jgi:exopolysaccharide biosynthesis polyprenyl glycosylphosphotransferase
MKITEVSALQKQIMNISVLFIADISASFAALFLSHHERLWLNRLGWFGLYDGQWARFTFSGLLFGLLIMLFYGFGLYVRRNDFWEETRKIFQIVFFLFIFVATYVFVTKTSYAYSRAMIIMIFVNLMWLLPTGRLLAKRGLYASGVWQKKALIVGESEQKRRLTDTLTANWYMGYVPYNRGDDTQKTVFIATQNMPVQELEALVNTYKKSFRDIIVLPYLNKLSFINAEIVDLPISQTSMINIQNQLFYTKNILLKHIVETTMVLMVLPFFALLYILFACWIKLDSSASVLFRQKRLGKDGKIFECYKFRTMYEDNEKILSEYLKAHPEEASHYERYHKYLNDPRITRAGYWLRKLSLDELPQILNVLKGDMSLIGPRPYMVSEKDKLGQKAETILHVKPGITGLWQIKGRNNLTFKERIEYDVWYIQNWSLWLDFIIFIKTFEVLITREGAR